RMMTLGRQKFVLKLSRDEQQCFREAGLLARPPSQPVRLWWDRISGQARLAADQIKLEQGRAAEILSISRETERLRRIGIQREPIWISVEDNTAGYDVLSYDSGVVEPTNRLIEVKSTTASPLRFNLTRNEWNKALEFGTSYHFHIWDMQAVP